MIREAVHSFEGAEEVVDAFYVKLVGQMAGQTVRGEEPSICGVCERAVTQISLQGQWNTTTRDRGRG